MIQNIIDRFKRIRTYSYLAQTYRHKYAFVGMGQHSLSNLYPVLDYLKVPLKYICVTSEKKAKLIGLKFHNTIGTNSLAEVLADDEVKGIFVAASPLAHFSIATEVLKSGMALFIEKPPCQSADKLKELINQQQAHGNIVAVGLQKRYAPCVKILKKRLDNERIISYNMRYLTGLYPEGNALTDLFIHPIDLAIHLFGKPQISACEKIGKNSYMLLLKHGNIVGNIELSTHYSWKEAQETLSICTQSGIYEMRQLESLTYSPIQRSLLGIPTEKIMPQRQIVEHLFTRNNFSPIIANNQIFTQGFYNEIQAFANTVEGKRANLFNADNKIVSSLTDITSTYDIIEKLGQL